MLLQNIAQFFHLADGTSAPQARADRENSLVVTENRGRYAEKTSRGGTFLTFIDALTILATHASPLAAGTGTPIIGIYNPVGSGVNIEIIKAGHATTSGTPAGPLKWNVIPNPQNITAGVAGNLVSALINGAVASVAKLFNNTATTGSTAGTVFRPHGGPAAIAEGAGIQSYVEEHAGDLIIPPGSMLALAATGTGTTHILSAFVEWQEVAAA